MRCSIWIPPNTRSSVTVRKTEVTLAENAKLNVMEKLMTHDQQTAVSDMTVELNGAGSTARIVSRSVAKGTSVQTFHPIAVGNALCHAHVQCDSIIMDQAQISSIRRSMREILMPRSSMRRPSEESTMIRF